MNQYRHYIVMPESAIFLTTPRILHNHLELDFLLNEVFHGITLTTDTSSILSAQTIVYAEYDLDINLITGIKNSGRRLVILHLGDERATKDLSGYEYADVILRNYYFEHILTDDRWKQKIHWIPNGYRSGVGTRPGTIPKQISERQQLCCFIGWLGNKSADNNERVRFADAVSGLSDLINCIPTQGFAAGFSPTLYRQLMENTVFAPAPAGNAHETIRLCDAMEIGCIPISTRHPFLMSALCMPGAPIILLEDWKSLGNILRQAKKSLIENIIEAKTAQEAVYQYWNAYKRKVNSLAAMAIWGKNIWFQ